MKLLLALLMLVSISAKAQDSEQLATIAKYENLSKPDLKGVNIEITNFLCKYGTSADCDDTIKQDLEKVLKNQTELEEKQKKDTILKFNKDKYACYKEVSKMNLTQGHVTNAVAACLRSKSWELEGDK